MKKELSNFGVVLRLLKLVKPLTLPMIAAITLGVLGFICAIGIPVVSMMVLLQLAGMHIHLSINYLLPLLLIMAIMRGVLHYFEQACNHYIAFKLLAVIRDHVFTALRKLAPAKLDGEDKGNLISLITNDIELLEVFYAHTISPVMIAFFTSVILLMIFAHMHIIPMVIALLSYCLMGIVIPYFVNKYGNQEGQKSRDEIGNLSSFILESYRGLSTIMQYGYGNLRTKQMLDKNNQIHDIQSKMKNIEAYQTIVSQVFISLSTVFMFIICFSLYLKGNMSIYAVIMSTVLLSSSFGPVMALSALSNNLLSTLSSGRRVIALLDEKPVIQEVKGLDEVIFDDIDIQDLSFQYEKDDQILDHFHAHFQKGKTTGIIGKSGSGKSTLLKLIMRFYDPKEGSITINQRNIKDINTDNMRQMFAYVTQETVLFHDSILNNIKIANINATDEEVYEACKKASIHDFIVSLPQGYQTPVAELGSSLSSGERQRIGLARAFLSQAECILLDEPTSQLDVLNEAMILNSLNQSSQTKILVSHREATMKIAHDVIQINQGRVS